MAFNTFRLLWATSTFIGGVGSISHVCLHVEKGRLSDRSWRAFAFTFAAAFVVSAFLWVSTISGYGNFA